MEIIIEVKEGPIKVHDVKKVIVEGDGFYIHAEGDRIEVEE